MIDLRELVARICNKDSGETFDPATDSLEALAIAVAAAPRTMPTLSLYEGWKDDVAGIDPSLWDRTNPATGTAWANDAGTGAMVGTLRAMTAPNANETARLRSMQRWLATPDLFLTNSIVKGLLIEWEMAITAGLANLDNTLTFWGFTAGGTATRATNNIIGFGLVGDALQTITDDGGAESVNTGFGEALANRNLLGMVLGAGSVGFYLNGTLIATHVTNLPDNPCYLNFFLDTEAGGACTFQLGPIRMIEVDVGA